MPSSSSSKLTRLSEPLSCFDGVLLRIYLPLERGWTMAQFLRGEGRGPLKLNPSLLEQAGDEARQRGNFADFASEVHGPHDKHEIAFSVDVVFGEELLEHLRAVTSTA